MYDLMVNLAGVWRTENFDGIDYIVVPMTMIVPGVLNGSQGPLLYPLEEIARNPKDWNGIPITLGHPKGADGQHVSAKGQPAVGRVHNARVDGKLIAEAWFNASLAPAKLLESIKAGEPVELSTGLMLDPEPKVGTHNGVQYTHIARNYRPDHLAVLMSGERGACGVKHGCGVNVNKRTVANAFFGWLFGNAAGDLPSDAIDPEKACQILKDGEVKGQPLTDAQQRMFAAACKGAPATNVWSDAARAASIEARRASMAAHAATLKTKGTGWHKGLPGAELSARGESKLAKWSASRAIVEKEANYHVSASLDHAQAASKLMALGHVAAAALHTKAGSLHDRATAAHGVDAATIKRILGHNADEQGAHEQTGNAVARKHRLAAMKLSIQDQFRTGSEGKSFEFRNIDVGGSMDRQKAIDTIAANCECKKEALNALSDEELERMRAKLATNSSTDARLTAEEREDLEFARNERRKQKSSLIAKLINNAKEGDAKAAYAKLLESKPISELQVMVDVQPEAKGAQPLYVGAAAGWDGGAANSDGTGAPLVPPSMGWGRKGG